VRKVLSRIWSLLDHFGRAVLAWQLGGAFLITGLVGLAIWALDAIPTAFLILLLLGLFFLSFASVGLWAPHVLHKVPAAPNPRRPEAHEQESQSQENEWRRSSLQKVRLIRNEIDEGTRIVERAIGVSQVHDLVDDTYWIGHRNELAAIPEAGDAHRLAGTAWQGFRRYNNAVKGRTHISDEDLEAIVADGRRAVDALGVAADSLR
jgi:hypothetical protein